MRIITQVTKNSSNKKPLRGIHVSKFTRSKVIIFVSASLKAIFLTLRFGNGVNRLT